MKSFLGFVLTMGLCVCAFWGGQALAEKEPRAVLYSHYEFSSLKPEHKEKYLKTLREVMVELEKIQTQSGVKYASVFNEEVLPWWASWLETAEAQTRVEKGAPCIYAGNFTVYAQSRRKTCTPIECEGKPGYTQCNPLLYDNICTKKGDGATARCERATKKTFADLAASASTPEGRKLWSDFKDQFDALCPGVYTKKNDIQYRSCKYVESRMQKVQVEIDKQPAPTAPTPVQGTAANRPEILPGACSMASGNPVSGSCMTCPDYLLQTQRPRDQASGRYGQLIKAMATNCGIENKSDSSAAASGVSAKSESELIKKFGVCMESDLQTGLAWEDQYEDPKSKTLISALANGDKSAHRAMSGGRWFNPHSEAFQDYFGLNARDARQAFCTGKSAEESLSVLRKLPEFGFMSGTGIGLSEIKELLRDNNEITRVPMSFQNVEWNNVDGTDRVKALNTFKKQAFRREKLAACIEKNLRNPNRHTRIDLHVPPPNCVLEVYKASETQMNATVVKLIQEGNNVVCLKGKWGSGYCTHCRSRPDGGVDCNCVNQATGAPLASAESELAVLKCGSLPGNARCNTPSGACPSRSGPPSSGGGVQ